MNELHRRYTTVITIVPFLLTALLVPALADGPGRKVGGHSGRSGGNHQRQSSNSGVQRPSYNRPSPRPSAPRVQSRPQQRTYRAPQVRYNRPAQTRQITRRPQQPSQRQAHDYRGNRNQQQANYSNGRPTSTYSSPNNYTRYQPKSNTRRNYRPHNNNNNNNNVVVNNYRPSRPARPVQVNNNVVVRQPYVTNRPIVYTQPYVYSQPYCPPTYNTYYNSPYYYSNYNVRRSYRPRRTNCLVSLLSLGFYLVRPYNTYNYARVGYDRPYYYGDDSAFQAPLDPTAQGGPVADAVTADSASQLASASAATAPAAQTQEQALITSVSSYVDAHTANERFALSDAAFKGETWNLDLAQAPAVFEIADGVYSVVAGFEGTLGQSQVPSNVVVEFFVARQDSGYQVKNAWITSTNGIPRAKLYQSPVYPDVKTWQPGQVCPFSGRPMVEIKEPKQG